MLCELFCYGFKHYFPKDLCLLQNALNQEELKQISTTKLRNLPDKSIPNAADRKNNIPPIGAPHAKSQGEIQDAIKHNRIINATRGGTRQFSEEHSACRNYSTRPTLTFGFYGRRESFLYYSRSILVAQHN